MRFAILIGDIQMPGGVLRIPQALDYCPLRGLNSSKLDPLVALCHELGGEHDSQRHSLWN